VLGIDLNADDARLLVASLGMAVVELLTTGGAR